MERKGREEGFKGKKGWDGKVWRGTDGHARIDRRVLETPSTHAREDQGRFGRVERFAR